MASASAFVAEPSTATLRALNYTPEVEALRKRKRSIKLGRLLSEMGPAYGAVFVRLDCDREHGVELITQGDMFAAEPVGRIIRRDSMARPERHQVKRWQVLISGAGTLGENELYGRAIIADSRLADRYVGPHAMVLTFLEPGSDNNLFTYAFLCSKVGIRAIRSTSFGTKILGLRKDLLAELPVPDAKGGIKARVASHVRRAVEQRETYLRELDNAQNLLTSLREGIASNSGLYGRGVWQATLTTPILSIAARNHRPARYAFSDGTRIAELIRSGWPKKANRFARVRCSEAHGVAFLGQRDLFLIRPVPQHIRKPASPEGLIAEVGTIIVAAAGQSGEGTLFGRIELGDHFSGRAVSEHTLHLHVEADKIDHHYLFAVLRSPWGTAALKSCATGTSVPSLEPSLLVNLRVPRLVATMEAVVAAHVSAAYEARKAADAAETEAIRIIEKEVLPAWLT